jgi:acyl-CoA dehydrogenase
MEHDPLSDAVTSLFADHSSPAAVRRAAVDGADRSLWQHLVDGGYDRALVPEHKGGSGLTLREVAGVLQACGRFAAPVPLGEAMFAQAFAAAGGGALPDGVISAAPAVLDGDRILASAVPWGESADWVLAVNGAIGYVVAVTAATASERTPFGACGERSLHWPRGAAVSVFEAPGIATDWGAAGACLRTAQIAGALTTVLDMTLRYAGERVQFGRPLAKFQAIQQQIAVLAEDAFAARMAAELACDSDTVFPDADAAAAAKSVASGVAARAAGIAHAVHGAMGIAAEHDLHLFTHRLLAWRTQYGSEARWSKLLGARALQESGTAWDFVRSGGSEIPG